MSQPSEVAATIQANIDAAGVLVLPGDALGSATMQASFNTYLIDDSLVIDGAVIQTSDTAVTVTGTGGGRFAGLATTAVFTPMQDGDTDVVVTGKAPANWLLSAAFPSLAGGSYDFVPFAADSQLALYTIGDAGHPAGLSLDGALPVAGLLATATPFLAATPATPVAGPIGVVNQTPSFDIAAVAVQGLTVGTLSALDFVLKLVSTPVTYYATDGVTVSTTPSYTQDAYVAFSTDVSFDTKSGEMGVTLTMRFGIGVIATLDVGILGDPGVVLDAFYDWANAELALGLPDPALFNPADALTLDSLAFFILPDSGVMSSFHMQVSTVKPWTIVPDVIAITQVTFRLISTNPTQGGEVSGNLFGAVDLGAHGSVAKIVLSGSTPNYAFSGALQDGTTVDVSALIEYLIPGAIGIPEIELTEFEFFCQAGAEPYYSMAAQFSLDWQLDVSPFKMAVTKAGASVAYGVSSDGSGTEPPATTTGLINGEIVFNDSVTFDITYGLPGPFQVTGAFDRISLLSAVERLANMPLNLPSGFDLDFTDCTALICYGSDGQSSTLEFQISATVPGLGQVSFDALEIQGEWGYAAGLSLGDVSLSKVPGLSALAPFDTYFKFKTLVLVVSTADLPGFVFAGQVLLPPGQSLVVGMNAYADIDLSIQPDLSLLMKFLNVAVELAITLQVGLDSVQDGSALFATLNGAVNGNIEIAGSFGAKLIGGVLELYMTGTLATTLQGQPITFFFTLAFEDNGAFLSGGYQGTIDFVIVKLSNLIVEIGIDFEGVPTIGFGAQIDVDRFDSSVMILLDSMDPAQSMFIASISDISLGVFLETLCNLTDLSGVPPAIMSALEQTGLSGTDAFAIADADNGVSDSLNARDVAAVSAAFATAGLSLPSDALQVIISVAVESELWYVTDIPAVLHYRLAKPGAGQAIAGSLEAQLYVVPQPTQLGLTMVQQGYRANATLDLFGFKAVVEVAIADRQGLTIDVAFSKIIVAVDAYPVFSLTSADGATGPALSVCTFTNVANPDVAKQNPHFFASGKVGVLGVVTESVLVNFTGSGGSFQIDATAYGLATYSMGGSYSDTFSFSANGSAMVGVDEVFDFGVLGKVHVQCQVGYEYKVSVTDARSGSASASADFNFGGVDFSIPSFSLSLDSDSLAALATDAADQVYAALQAFFALSEQWLSWVYSGLVLGVETAEQVGQSLEAAYTLAYDAIATQTTDILKYSTDQVTAALQGAGATADEAYDVLVSTLGVPVEQAAKAVEDFFTGSGAHLDQILIPGYNDNTLHVDNGGYNDNTLHIDTGGYNDNTIHIDTGGYNDNTIHIDNSGYNDRTLHVDTHGYNDRTLHVDSHTIFGHDDTGHIDYGHDDTGHIDYGHNDSGHIDTGHDDTGHIDTGHDDTGHIDTGHDDTGHIDTPDTHVDTKV